MEAFVTDLKRVRSKGLGQLPAAEVPALAAAAGGGTSEIKGLLLRIVGEIRDRDLAQAVLYTLALEKGTEYQPAAYRRKKAAEILERDPSYLSRYLEERIFKSVAEALREACLAGEGAGAREEGPPPVEMGTSVTIAVPSGAATLKIRLVRQAFVLLSGLDVVVSSENTYLEMGKTFGNSLSSTLRQAGRMRRGGVVEDVLQRGLDEWLDGRPVPVPEGTVVPTEPGGLSGQGVRRVYHAAVVRPLDSRHRYAVDPAAVRRAVRNVFDLARKEREEYRPPLRRLLFPIFGIGSGALDPGEGTAYLWGALEPELNRDGADWEASILLRGERGTRAATRFFERRGGVVVTD